MEVEPQHLEKDPEHLCRRTKVLVEEALELRVHLCRKLEQDQHEQMKHQRAFETAVKLHCLYRAVQVLSVPQLLAQ